MPQISVIVPVYKVEPYLHRCVDSILGQTFTDFELILVDDGSPDNCPAICDAYAEKDSRVHVIHQTNGGLSAARNAGIDWAFANSDSQWLTFIDSDDWVHPEYLERLLSAAVENNVSVSVCSYVETEGEEPEITAQDIIPTIWNPEPFFVEHTVNAAIACAKLYRKECFSEIRYPVGKLHEDEFTTYKILFAQTSLAVITAPMYFYYVNPHGIMNSKWSPKRLDGIEARKQQIAYFEEHGYSEAHKRAAYALLWNIATHVQKLQAEQTNKGYLKRLRKQLRKEMHQYKRELSLSLASNYGLYEVAYPRFMKYYWLWQVVLRKLHIRK